VKLTLLTKGKGHRRIETTNKLPKQSSCWQQPKEIKMQNRLAISQTQPYVIDMMLTDEQAESLHHMLTHVRVSMLNFMDREVLHRVRDALEDFSRSRRRRGQVIRTITREYS
jgi:hypothetical protein